ncbi:hypothetical protein PQX77_001630 [Marasmius sp. AFHP31]|nr:hypothetical protein PQX77_001630 [Marasmius sp. AFHP31]
MSSNKTPVRKGTRSSEESTTSRTQSLRSSTADEPQPSPETFAPVEFRQKSCVRNTEQLLTVAQRPVVSNESQKEGIPGPIGPPEPSTKPLEGMDPEVQDTDAASDPTSAKEKVLPDHATDQDKGKHKLNTDTGPGEQTPPDHGTKTDNRTGNEDDARKVSEASALLTDFVSIFNDVKTPQEPTLEKSWDVIMKEVTSLDEGLVGGWKEDIDTLLVFAGLFSAVVTAFTIESYQWLQEAPEDTTVALLRQISQQLNNTSESVPEPDTFTVSSSVVAINVLWFLSLIIALVDALFALLCKQWLREHRRHTHTRTPSEALALRWLRHQSLEKWRVPAILASLPMLLELALFLFLAGLLELLRTRHPVPFSIATFIVAFAAVFYLGTTIIPAVDIARQALQVTRELRHERTHPYIKIYSPVDFIMTLPPMEYICPYKSPQAWVAFQSLRMISRVLDLLLRHMAFCLLRRGYIAHSTYWDLFGLSIPIDTFQETVDSLLNWSSVDLELLQRSSIDLAPPFYDLNAFRWLVTEVRDSPHMIPHLRNVLSTLPLHLVMPVVFDQWFFLPGRKWTVGDIEKALAPNFIWPGIDDHLTYAKQQVLTQGRETRLFNYLLHWVHVSMNGGDERTDSGRASPDLSPIPFRSVDAMPNDGLRAGLWDIYPKISQDPAASDYYWVTLIQDLAPYIIASSPEYALHDSTTTTTSLFVQSAEGCEFLSKIHSTIFERKLFEIDRFWETSVMFWMEAMDILRRVRNFPENHFKPIPGHFPLPLTKLRKTLNTLSPTDPDNDFRYLDRFSRGWGDTNVQNKMELVVILSEHINNYPESEAEPSHCPGKPNISPLVMSPAGLELMTFVNDRLAEEVQTWRLLGHMGRTGGWRNAIERVRAARLELPPDYFKNIVPQGIDFPAVGERPSQRESEVEAQEGDSGGGTRDVTNTGEVAHDANEMNVRPNSAAEPSPQPEPGELDKQRPALDDGDTNEKESILRQPVMAVNPATASGSPSSVVQGEKMVGGPDADKNV